MIELKDTCKNFVNYLNVIYTYDYFYPNHMYIEHKSKEDIYAMQDKHRENMNKYYNVAYNLCVAIEGTLFTNGICSAFKDPYLADNLENPNKKISVYANDDCLDFVTGFMGFGGDIITNVHPKKTRAVKTKKDSNGHTILPQPYVDRLNAIYDSIKDFALFGNDCTEYEIIADAIENINLDGTFSNNICSHSMIAIETAVMTKQTDYDTHYYQDDAERIANIYFALLCYNNGLFLTDLEQYAEENCESFDGDLWDAENIAFKNLQAEYPDEYDFSFSYSEQSELHYRILNGDTKAMAELKKVADHYEDYDTRKEVE